MATGLVTATLVYCMEFFSVVRKGILDMILVEVTATGGILIVAIGVNILELRKIL